MSEKKIDFNNFNIKDNLVWIKQIDNQRAARKAYTC